MLLTNDQVVDEVTLPSIESRERPATSPWPGTRGILFVIIDGLIMLLSLKIAQLAISWSGQAQTGAWPVRDDEIILVFLLMAAFLGLKGRYSARIPCWDEIRVVGSASLCALGCEAWIGIISNDILSRLPLLLALVLFPALATGANRLTKSLLARAGIWTIPLVVVGSHQCVTDAERILTMDPSLGYSVVGKLDPATIMSEAALPRLRPVLQAYHAKSLVIATDGSKIADRQLIECALQERIPFSTMMLPYVAPTFASKSTCFFSHDSVLLSFHDGLAQPIPRIAKSTADILVALALLVITAPFLLAISFAIRLDGGPVLFRQLRIGVAGRPFYCLKFRTMIVDADRKLEAALAGSAELRAEWNTHRKLRDDPRITRVGRFLRKTSLDELPQLINVLRRDMSLVGPRPIVASEVPLYGDHIAQYYATRPGLTGLWQVSGRSNTTFERRVQLDVWYVNNWTFWHDIVVLLKTIPAVFKRQGAI